MKDDIRVKDTVIRGKWWLLPKPEKEIPHKVPNILSEFYQIICQNTRPPDSPGKRHHSVTPKTGSRSGRCQNASTTRRG